MEENIKPKDDLNGNKKKQKYFNEKEFWPDKQSEKSRAKVNKAKPPHADYHRVHA